MKTFKLTEEQLKEIIVLAFNEGCNQTDCLNSIYPIDDKQIKAILLYANKLIKNI